MINHSDKLRFLRSQKKLTQKSAALLIGLTPRTYMSYECGQMPKFQSIKKTDCGFLRRVSRRDFRRTTKSRVMQILRRANPGTKGRSQKMFLHRQVLKSVLQTQGERGKAATSRSMCLLR